MKSDVYSFGVVLLQILTGLTACDYSQPQERLSLVDWAIPLLSHKTKLQTISDADKHLYISQEATETAKLAQKCLNRYPQERPSMEEVVTNLELIRTNRTTRQWSLLLVVVLVICYFNFWIMYLADCPDKTRYDMGLKDLSISIIQVMNWILLIICKNVCSNHLFFFFFFKIYSSFWTSIYISMTLSPDEKRRLLEVFSRKRGNKKEKRNTVMQTRLGTKNDGLS